MRTLLASVAGVLLVASVATAQTITPIKRTELQKTEYPDGHVIYMQLLVAEPGTPIPRHTHPGVETSYILEGEVELTVDGKGTMTLKAGDSFAVPAHVPHSGKFGAKQARLIVTYVVDKSKPVATLVK